MIDNSKKIYRRIHMDKKHIFRGAATALVTPFRDGGVDYKALGILIDRQISLGIDALVICGTTGEASTLSDTEHKRVLSFALERAGGRVPMIAGTGSNNTSHAIEMSKFASSLGYDALLTVTPYYNKASERGLVKSFSSIADASEKPLILYNVPSRTSCNITLPVYRELARHENVVAVKEAGGNISAIAELICECGNSFDIYSGNDDQTLPILSLGGAGVISVVSNIIPTEMSALCRAWFDREPEKCRELHERYLRLMKAMFFDVNPIPVKTALSLIGLCSDEMRLPLCEMTPARRGELVDCLVDLGVMGC